MTQYNDAAGSCGKMLPRFLVVDKSVMNTLSDIQTRDKADLPKNSPGWLFTHLYNKLEWLKDEDQSKYDNISLELEQSPEVLKDALVEALFNSG